MSEGKITEFWKMEFADGVQGQRAFISLLGDNSPPENRIWKRSLRSQTISATRRSVFKLQFCAYTYWLHDLYTWWASFTRNVDAEEGRSRGYLLFVCLSTRQVKNGWSYVARVWSIGAFDQMRCAIDQFVISAAFYQLRNSWPIALRIWSI